VEHAHSYPGLVLFVSSFGQCLLMEVLLQQSHQQWHEDCCALLVGVLLAFGVDPGYLLQILWPMAAESQHLAHLRGLVLPLLCAYVPAHEFDCRLYFTDLIFRPRWYPSSPPWLDCRVYLNPNPIHPLRRNSTLTSVLNDNLHPPCRIWLSYVSTQLCTWWYTSLLLSNLIDICLLSHLHSP
jgi:hypothetical protein